MSKSFKLFRIQFGQKQDSCTSRTVLFHKHAVVLQSRNRNWVERNTRNHQTNQDLPDEDF